MVELKLEDRGQRTENSLNGSDPDRRMALRFNIGRDALERAVVELPDDQRAALERFWRYCNDRNIDRTRLGSLIKKSNGDYYSADSIYQALTGRRTEAGASLEPICRSIEQFLRQVEPKTGAEKFIETSFARAIWRYCERAKKLNAVGFIFGDMSIGKSDAVLELARRDHETLYTRMPTRGHLNHFLSDCARGLAMGDRQTVANLRHRIIEALPKRWVIDEADQCFAAIRNNWGLATFDFIREAWDRRRSTGRPISIIFVMDHFGRDCLIKGQHSGRLKRLWRRRLPRLQLPAVLPREDRIRFAAAVGLPAAPNAKVKASDPVSGKSFIDNPAELEKAVLKSDGLGYWKMILNYAAEIAREQRRAITWGAVIKAHAMFAAEEAREEESE